jgi:hypothetical protein
VTREENDPLGHLRQGLQWQAEADQRSVEAAVAAGLVELGVPGAIKRFRATNPPPAVLKELDAILLKLKAAAYEVVRANPGRPGRPPSRWELEALQELREFAGEAPVEQPHPVERPSPSPMKRLPQPSYREAKASPTDAPESLPEKGEDRHKTLIRWYQEARAAGAHNRTMQDAAVNARAERAGASLRWQECVDARKAANVAGASGPKRKL